MSQRVQITELTIAEGAIVRQSMASAKTNKDKAARWRVLGIDKEQVKVHDREDSEDLRTFDLKDLELVSGGEYKTRIVNVNGPVSHKTQYTVEVFDDQDDPYDDSDGGVEEPVSLFDDPIKLQQAEDEEDEDYEADEEDEEDELEDA